MHVVFTRRLHYCGTKCRFLGTILSGTMHHGHGYHDIILNLDVPCIRMKVMSKLRSTVSCTGIIIMPIQLNETGCTKSEPKKGECLRRGSCSPPQLAQGLGELSVVQVRVLVGQFTSCGLGPHHECVHRPLDVRLALFTPWRTCGHGHQRPVISLEHLTDGVLDVAWVVGVVRPAATTSAVTVDVAQLAGQRREGAVSDLLAQWASDVVLRAEGRVHTGRGPRRRVGSFLRLVFGIGHRVCVCV